jgi:hypothetical protein
MANLFGRAKARLTAADAAIERSRDGTIELVFWRGGLGDSTYVMSFHKDDSSGVDVKRKEVRKGRGKPIERTRMGIAANTVGETIRPGKVIYVFDAKTARLDSL